MTKQTANIPFQGDMALLDSLGVESDGRDGAVSPVSWWPTITPSS